MVEEVSAFSGSDWAGCEETRKASSAGVIFSRQPNLESIHAQAQHHCKKQCRGRELYAAALGASESKGIVSLLKDLVYEMKQVLPLMRRPLNTFTTYKELVD